MATFGKSPKMSTLSVTLIIITLALASFIVYRFLSFKKAGQKQQQQNFERIRPLFEKFEKGEPVTKEDVYPYAQNLLTRVTAFNVLQHFNKSELFSAEFNKIQ